MISAERRSAFIGEDTDRAAELNKRIEEDGTDNYIHVRDAVMSIRFIDAIQEAGHTKECVML